MTPQLPDLSTVFETDFELEPDDLPPVPMVGSTYRPTGWWTTTEFENQFLDYPDFADGRERIRHMLARMISAAIEAGEATDWDVPVFPFAGRMLNGHDLLATTDDHADAMISLARQ
ncbi:hypothetical protein [Sphingomonas xinjiangensis]|uniref:Uncharacterized protein n=1 Tax=Sphingomonas xinjiangensis TaxID=643568 RepID=A0A840YNY0_9SPHN|nr:hypothetical protein [Sphingomonas xinjiangensis]MBB5709691.1 hypothetical protein [Sphingomonas xinjiangensis]